MGEQPSWLDEQCEDTADWREYERRKRSWLACNPGAYPCEIEHALKVIAQELGL